MLCVFQGLLHYETITYLFEIKSQENKNKKCMKISSYSNIKSTKFKEYINQSNFLFWEFRFARFNKCVPSILCKKENLFISFAFLCIKKTLDNFADDLKFGWKNIWNGWIHEYLMMAIKGLFLYIRFFWHTWLHREMCAFY